jgi:hypothetical protein
MRIGDTVAIPLTFTSIVTGLLVDPDTVVVQVKDAGTVVRDYDLADLTRVSLGTYRLLVTTLENDTAGEWVAFARATGTVTGSATHRFVMQDKWT